MSTHRLKTDSLAFSLLGAAHTVAQVRAGIALPQALAAVFAETMAPSPACGAIQDIAYRTMRQRGRADFLLSQLTAKTPSPPLLHGLLCCAIGLMCSLGDSAEDMPYETFTVVNQAVSAAASDARIAHTKGMVNAVLRRYLREQETLLQNAMRDQVAYWNYPEWWIEATKAAYPQDWQTILNIGNSPPPLTLRVNRRKTTPQEYLRILSRHSIDATQIGPDAIRLRHPLPVSRIPGFAEGEVSVQDAAAQLAAPLLDVHDGMRVLDACAAPGGKTGHILECAHVELLALDSDPRRLQRIDDNLQRLQLKASLRAGDASKRDWWDNTLFDRIVADVPCTASGIIRRHPDIRWLRRPSDTAQLATLSSIILDNLWQMLKPNGKLLFVTCSLWPQESEKQAAAFAARNHATSLAAPGQLLPTAGAEDGQDHDGLYYALFQKTAV